MAIPKRREFNGYQKNLKKVWRLTLRRAKIPYFRIYDLRSTCATCYGRVMRRCSRSYSQMKLQMKREALKKMNRKANESQAGFDTERPE